MSGLFGGPKIPKPLPIPQPEDAEAAAQKLRESIAGRAGRNSTLLTATVDSGRQRPSQQFTGA